MAVYQVIKYGEDNGILREKAKGITAITPSINKLLDDLRDTMYSYKGVGLAAPQIGVSKRAIVVDTGEQFIELINPEIYEQSGSENSEEGCLSLPGIAGNVVRAFRVLVKGLNRTGEEIKIDAKGYQARALQHEIDHLEGILFTDKATNLRKVVE